MTRRAAIFFKRERRQTDSATTLLLIALFSPHFLPSLSNSSLIYHGSHGELMLHTAPGLVGA